ncbi:MAG TPA: hypothetical protein VLQ93_18650, partial [Myxococcaceae bacterium]|nr:hypothetical protein [Myxococcaceae bacterium]
MTVPVRIEGENFLALATQHLGGGEPVSVDARFEAFLGDVPLEEIILEDERTLRARVPAGLALGWHTLTLRGPLGRVTLPRAWFASERTLARLGASAGLEASVVRVEQGTRLVLTVENTGETAALAVTPVLRLAGEGRVDVTSEPGPADIAPLERASFAWELRGVAPGEVRFSLELRGREALSGMELEAPPLEVGPLRVRSEPGLLSARFTVPASVNVGQEFEIGLEVENQGSSPVLGVMPSALGPWPEGLTAVVSGPEPGSADIPVGGRAVFRWRLTGEMEGTCTFSAGAAGTDPLEENTRVEAPVVYSSPVSVQRPAELVAMFSSPSAVGPGSTFEVRLSVFNAGGGTARGVLPAELVVSSDVVVPASTSNLTPVDLDGGAFASFSWSYRAARVGEVSFSTRVSGTDGNTGQPLLLEGLSQGPVSIQEALLLLEDPFGDGARFSQIVHYGGRLYLGPSRDGTGGVSVAPDGTTGQSFRFSFSQDTNGNVCRNDSGAPYPSIGVTGCAPDTPACGPHNENGRGL